MKTLSLLILFLVLSTLIACKNQQAKTCFTYSPGTVTTGTPVTFNASCTTDNIGNYVWNFGEGSKDTAVTSKTITHTYVSAGTYTVYLTAVGEGNWRHKGIPNTIQKTIIVN